MRTCSYDESNHRRFPVGDPNKRAFTYFVLTGSRFMYASAMRLVVLKFLLSWAVRPALGNALRACFCVRVLVRGC